MPAFRIRMIQNSLLLIKSILFHPALIRRYLTASREIVQFSGLKSFLDEVQMLLLLGNQPAAPSRLNTSEQPRLNRCRLESFLKSFYLDSPHLPLHNPREALLLSAKELIREHIQTGNLIHFPHHDFPLVSIVIPVFNQSAFTFQCLRSVCRHTFSISFEVIVVDDASRDDTAQVLRLAKGIQVITNPQNLGFAGACNRGAESAHGRYLLFLNNDTLVTPGWLEQLVQTMENYAACGAVGPRMLYPDGTVQEAGSILWRDGSALAYGRNGDPSDPEYSYLREVAYCSAACLLVKKDDFLDLGGFDPLFYPAYYEDSDLCLRIREMGRKVVFQPKSTVIHFEYGTSGAEKAAARMRRNRIMFANKWRHVLKGYPQGSPSDILRARDKRPGKRILVMDDRIPDPSAGSGFPRAQKMLRFLIESGYVVTFFPLLDRSPYQPCLEELQSEGVEVFYAPFAQVSRFIRERAGLYDALIISRHHNGARYLRAFRKAWPETAVIYDVEALFSIRDILKASAENIPLSDTQIASLMLAELAPMKEADMIIAVSPRESALISRFLDGAPLKAWGHPLEVVESTKPFEERKDFLFVGGFPFSASPNEDAVIYFIEHIWPLILSDLDCRIHIVGSNPPERLVRLASKRILVAGYVKDLREYYECCRVFIAPHRYAAGLPWKVHEAMSHGLPCVVSSLIGYQLGITNGKEALIGHTEADFATKAVLAYCNSEIWQTLRKDAMDYIGSDCDPQVLKGSLNEILNEAMTHKVQRDNGSMCF